MARINIKESKKMMKRPIFEITEVHANDIALNLYHRASGNFDQSNIDTGALTKLILDHGSGNDGYELAKKLEDITSCNIDCIIVEELDSIAYDVRKIEDDLNIAWVKENSITPLFKAGEQVVSRGKVRTIDEVNLTEAKYFLATDEPNKRHIVNYESVQGVKK